MTGKHIARIFIFLLLLLSLTACAGGGSGSTATSEIDSAQPVDRLFTDLYRVMGDAVGPAITPKFERGSEECQYTLNALLCYDPSRPEDSQFFLAPLASERDLAWPRLETTSKGLNIQGVQTLPEFYAFLFKYLNGDRFAGKPISPVIYNFQDQRLEQFFENLVIYRNFVDPIDEVHLMALGHEDCRQKQPDQCSYLPEVDDPIHTLVGYIEAPFPQPGGPLGNLVDFGRVLTPPYLRADGLMEQIWENVVFVWPQGRPEQGGLFPLSDWMQMPGTEPGPQLYDLRDGIIFYPVEDGLGYHIPVVFEDFRAVHGGQVVSGPPTGDYMMTEDGKAVRQCFVNYCLIFDLSSSVQNDLRVRLLPLGAAYRDQYYQPVKEVAAPVNLANARLALSMERPQVESKDTQVIEVTATDSVSGKPLAELQVRIRANLLDGTVFEVISDPTGKDGLVKLEIPPQPGFQHGLVVGYQACLLVPDADPVCQYDSYLLWDLPE